MNTKEIDRLKTLANYENADETTKKVLEEIFGKEYFEKSLIEKIATIDDILKANDITPEQFEESCKGLEPDEIAYRLAKLLAKSLNGDWIADWTNNNEYKYYPWFTMGSPSGVGFACLDFDHWYSHSHVGSRLCFKSKELAEYAGKQFEQTIYKPLMTI